jgi:hypothetical protein
VRKEAEERAAAEQRQPTPEEMIYWQQPVTTMSLLPPGTWRTWISGRGWGGILSGRLGVDLAFTDRAGLHWVRRANGQLEELPADPLAHPGSLDTE